MIVMDVVKGYVTQITDNGARAKVETFEGEILDDVLMLYPYGTASHIQSDGSSLVLLFKSLGSKTNIFGIPYNVPLQPSLESSEVAFGNFKKGNKTTFKSNNDIDIDNCINLNIDASKLDLNGVASVDGAINTNDVYKVGDVQVVSGQGASVPDATGGVTVDTQARAAINSLLARLRTHGLIAP